MLLTFLNHVGKGSDRSGIVEVVSVAGVPLLFWRVIVLSTRLRVFWGQGMLRLVTVGLLPFFFPLLYRSYFSAQLVAPSNVTFHEACIHKVHVHPAFFPYL